MLVTTSASRGSVLQTLTLQCPMGEECVKVWRRGSITSVVGPDPLQDLRQQHAAVLVGVSAVTPEMPHLVTRAERAVLVGLGVRVLERGQHLLVRQEPVAVLVRQV